MKVGILSNFPSPAVQSGPAIHTRFLHDGLTRRGHHVTMMGPDTGDIVQIESQADVLFPAFGYATHPNVRVAMPPRPSALFRERPDVDLIHGQANCHMLHYGVWARQMWGIPFLNTHIIHLPTHSHFLLSDRLYGNEMLRDWLRDRALDMERNFATHIYNQSDCFIVQSKHMVNYWRERGVTTPIEVVGRPINPSIFSNPTGVDPFPAHFTKGHRLLVVCRHDREKALDQLIRIFAEEIAPRDPKATLTLVGDGHDHLNLVAQALETQHADRIHFSGEVKHDALINWYANSDLFVYTSISETFGNVVNEALYSYVPVVAFDDAMGVAGQIEDGKNGVLINPHTHDANVNFAKATVELLAQPERRQQMGEAAHQMAHNSAHPDVVLSRFEKIYADAQLHRQATLPVPLEKQGRMAQLRAFTRHYSAWAWWNGALLTIGQAAKNLGASRSGGYEQHADAQKLVAEKSKSSVIHAA